MKQFYLLFSALLLTMFSFAQIQLPLDFESATTNYTFTDFGGGATTKIANPQAIGINTSANVAKMVKGLGEVYGGSVITLAAPIDFSVNKTFKVKVFSPRVGAKLLLKVENATDGTINFQQEATSTVANAWEDLTFDYSAISTTNQYSKLVFIFDNGTSGDGTANYTWLFDEVRLAASGGGGSLTQMTLPVTFDDATVNYGLVGFAGAEQSTIAADPTLSTNQVAKVIRTNTAATYAGTTVTALSGTVQTGFSTNIPFSATEKRMNVRVYSPVAGIQVRLKVEDKTDPTKSCETEATVTTANGWQTLEFNFANQASGTSALNLTYSLNKATIFFNFGVSGTTAGQQIYYFDDVKFGGAAVTPPTQTQMTLPVTFDDATVNYGLVGFAGAEQSTIAADPTLSTNQVAKVIRTNTAATYAGTTITALSGTVQTGFSTNIPFSATEKRMNVRIYSPVAGIQVRLKVEDKTDPTKSCETEATVTTANGWQTLEFNFANQASGTSALNLTYSLNKATIFFNFGVSGTTAGQQIYYFDDVKFGGAAVTPPTQTQMTLPVTFDDATVNYGLVGFAGAEQSTIAADPTLSTNQVAKVIRTNTAATYAGTTITALSGTVQTGFSTNIPFSATEKRMNVRIYSPVAGIQVRLKVEDKTDPTKSCETEATVTTANGWQTLEFNFANQASGTSALNLTYSLNKATIFFNFGVSGTTAGQQIYYFDDVKFGGAAVTPPTQTQMTLPVTFDDATVNYGLVGFAGAEQSTIAADPTLSTNQVAKVIRTNTAATYAGTTITALSGTVQTGFSTNIPFSATEKRMNVRVYSPVAGIQVRLKVEDKTDPTKSCETEATVTTANGWQTLEFNFANQASGTSALNLTYSLNKATIFFNFGVSGTTAGQQIYYFDDVKFGGAAVTPPTQTQMTLPVTFDDATVNYGLVGFAGAEQSTIVADPTLATNKVAKVIKTNTAELYAGTTITAQSGAVQTGFSSNIPFTATEKRMNVRVYSPHAGIQVRLKVEDKNDPTHSCETEATVTTANGWQTLEFNFANQAAGTAALNLAYSLNKATIFFNFGVTGAVAGERTYYFDDVKFGAALLPPAPPAPIVTSPIIYCQNSIAAPLSATALAGNILSWYTVAANGTASATAPTPSTTAAGTTNYYVSQKTSAGVEGPRATITVTVNTAPLAPTVSTPLLICLNAQSSSLTATAAIGNTLNWYTVAMGDIGVINAPTTVTSTAGSVTYYVSQTNNLGCEGLKAALIVTIVAPPAPPVIATTQAQITPGQTTTIAAANPPGSGNTYSWFRNGIVITAQSGNSIPVNIDGVGSYTLKVTSALGCVSTSNTVNITEANSNKLFVYPNPSNGKFQVRYFTDPNNLQPLQIAIYNSLGALIFSGKYTSLSSYSPMNIDLTKHGNGVYHLKMMNAGGKIIATETIIVHK